MSSKSEALNDCSGSLRGVSVWIMIDYIQHAVMLSLCSVSLPELYRIPVMHMAWLSGFVREFGMDSYADVVREMFNLPSADLCEIIPSPGMRQFSLFLDIKICNIDLVMYITLFMVLSLLFIISLGMFVLGTFLDIRMFSWTLTILFVKKNALRIWLFFTSSLVFSSAFRIIHVTKGSANLFYFGIISNIMFALMLVMSTLIIAGSAAQMKITNSIIFKR